MKLRLSIAHQGIALAIIPLAFELFFLFTLMNFLHDTEEKIQNQFRFRSIIEHANMLQRTSLKYASVCSLHDIYGTPELLHQRNEAAVKVLLELTELEKFSREEPVLKEQFNVVKQSVQELFNDLLPEARSLKYPANSIVSLLQLFSQSLTVDLIDALHEYYETVTELDKKSSLAQEKTENRLNLVIGIGIISNIIVSLALVLLFTRYVTSRLSVLSDNALRMTSKQPLHPPVKGIDEIASLDSVFHEMAADLETADSQKMGLLKFISDQLQIPLQKTLEDLHRAQEREKNNERIQKRLNPLRGNVLRLCSLVQELLDIENIDSGKLELSITKCSVKDIFDAAKSTMQGYASGKNLQILTKDTDICLKADALKLEQVIINFLSNAIKFSPPGASIKVEATVETDDSILVRVIDQGPGIPPEKLGLLFERFRQINPEADTKIGGSGLGLSICKKIIEAHGGDIGAANEEDGGSCFWFRLPCQPSTGGTNG